MLLRRCIARALSVGSLILTASVASAQAYPNKPLRIVTSEAGGGSDFVVRLVAQGLSASLGQQIIGDDRLQHGRRYRGLQPHQIHGIGYRCDQVHQTAVAIENFLWKPRDLERTYHLA